MRITESVKKLVAYTPGEQPKAREVVKLNTNENPYPPSPRCAKALADINLDWLRRYPDPVFTELRSALAKHNRTTPDRIFVGNGSDEILSLAARAFVENDETIASLDPSYSLYRTLAAIRDVRWIGEGCGFSPSAVEIRRRLPANTALYLWTNPNAPTGTLAPKEELAAFAKGFRGVLLIDEAYADFAHANCMELATAENNRNTIVMRTFSKSYALAGLRVGYCVGPRNLIDALYKIKDSYNVDAVAQSVALAALSDRRHFKATVSKVIRTRRAFTGELVRRGWDVFPSESNFVFAKPAHLSATRLFEALRQRNIFVRHFPGPLTGDRLRITIGTDEQMNILTKAIDELDIQS